jgi:hypothetical protein
MRTTPRGTCKDTCIVCVPRPPSALTGLTIERIRVQTQIFESLICAGAHVRCLWGPLHLQLRKVEQVLVEKDSFDPNLGPR